MRSIVLAILAIAMATCVQGPAFAQGILIGIRGSIPVCTYAQLHDGSCQKEIDGYLATVTNGNPVASDRCASGGSAGSPGELVTCRYKGGDWEEFEPGAAAGTPTAEYAALGSVNPALTPFVKVIDCDDLACASPGTGTTHVPFYHNGGAWVPFPGAAAGIASLSADPDPTLSADLDGGGHAITNIGNVDGRDVSADGSKLDTIASGATVGLGSDPAACPAGQVANDQNQSGVLGCVVDDDVPESGDFGAAADLEPDGSVSPAAVDGSKLATTGTPDGTKFLRDDMTWAAAPGAGGGIGGLNEDPDPTLTAPLDAAGFAILNPGAVDGRDVSVDGAKLDTVDVEYDQVIVLDDPATACADYTGMFESLHDGTIAAGQYRYRVVFNLVGPNKLVPETHFYDDSGNWPYKACFIHHPAKAGTFIGSFPDSIGRLTNGSSLTVNTANSSNMVIDYEGQIEIDETGLTEDAILFDLGNHYLAGCTDDTGSDDRCDTSWYGTLGGVIKPQGMVQVSITTGNDSGWTGQGIPSMSKTERLSDVTETSLAIVGAAGASYVDMSDWTIRVRGMDNDDIIYHSPSGWGTTPPSIIASQGLNDGYGAILYGAQNWSEPARHWSLKNLDHALLFGDPVNGGAQVFYESCDALDGGGATAAGTCGDANGVAWAGATYGVAIDALMAEGPTWSSIAASRLGDRNSIKNAYLEAGASFTGYSIALGSYFCDGATGTDPKLPKGSIVKEPGDCAAGGSGAALAAPLGTDSTARLILEANNYPAGQAAGGRAMLLGPRCTSSYDVELGGPADIDDNPDGSEFILSDAIASSGGCEIYALTNFASAPQAYYGLKRPHEAVGSVASDPIFDAPGDLVAGLVDNMAFRIPIGSPGQALTVSGGYPAWLANPGGQTSGAIAALTPKATPVGGDHLLMENSEGSNAKVRATVASLESALEAVIDLQDLQGELAGGTGGQITDDSITAADIAPNAVGASELADDAVTPAKVDSTGDFVFGSVAITDPGSGDRVWESPPNDSAEGLGTPASGNCRIGLVGATVAAAVPYFHCDGGSLTLIGGGGSGTITAVGPAYASGAAFTDGVASTGTTMLVWEGTTVDGNEFSLVAPTADPGADIAITFPNGSSILPIFGQQITFAGPTAPRTYTLPDAAATLARTDAAQSFTGTQTFGSSTPILLGTSGSTVGSIGFRNATSGTITVQPMTGALGTITQSLPPAAGIFRLDNLASVASAAATTTLNASSQAVQRITGSTTQTVQLPAVSASGMAVGRSWTIANDSTGLVTVNSSGGNAVAVLATGRRATFVANTTTGTDASVWTVVGTRWSGTTTLNPGAISANTCATAITATATGLATTDVITWGPASDITSVTGYNPASSPGIQIVPYPTANTVNFKLCNPTAGSITPGSISVNWAVSR